MPKPLNVDWSFVQSLWLQGLTPARISQKTGVKVRTIESKATRAGWRASLAKSQTALACYPQSDLMAHVAKSSSNVRSRLANTLDKSSEVLASLPLNGKTLDKRLESARKLAVVADPVFGWSADAQGPSHVSLTKIEVRPRSTDVETITPTNNDGPVVDVPYE